jgi:predicted RecB family nuclease
MMKRLEYLQGITEGECDSLRALGVRHTNQLIHATTLVIDRERIERRVGIPEERLYALGQQASLMEISGLQRHLRVVMRLGVSTLRQLAQADAGKLHGQLGDAIGIGAPTLSEVQYWVSQARYIDVVEDPPEATGSRIRHYVPG